MSNSESFSYSMKMSVRLSVRPSLDFTLRGQNITNTVWYIHADTFNSTKT